MNEPSQQHIYDRANAETLNFIRRQENAARDRDAARLAIPPGPPRTMGQILRDMADACVRLVLLAVLVHGAAIAHLAGANIWLILGGTIALAWVGEKTVGAAPVRLLFRMLCVVLVAGAVLSAVAPQAAQPVAEIYRALWWQIGQIWTQIVASL